MHGSPGRTMTRVVLTCSLPLTMCFMFVPLIFISFCYNFASALALYWTVQNLFSIVQLYLTKNQPVPKLQKRLRQK